MSKDWWEDIKPNWEKDIIPHNFTAEQLIAIQMALSFWASECPSEVSKEDINLMDIIETLTKDLPPHA